MKLRLPAILKLAIIAVCMMPAAMADTIKLNVGRAEVGNSFYDNYKAEKNNLTVNEGELVGYFSTSNDPSTLVRDFSNDFTSNPATPGSAVSNSLVLGTFLDVMVLKGFHSLKDLTINGSGQVYLGGQNGSNQYGGLVAGDVKINSGAKGTQDINNTNLRADFLYADTFTINDGSAYIRTMEGGGNSTGGSGYGKKLGIFSGTIIDSAKSATITTGLYINGGYLKMGRQGNYNAQNGNVQTQGNRTEKDSQFVNVISGTFKQTGGEAELLGKTYLNVEKIEQTGGTMKLAYDPTVGYDYLRLGQSATTISQSGGTMDIEGKIIYVEENGNDNMKLTIEQSSGKLSLQNGVMFTTKNNDANNASVIKQTGAGSIELNGDYSSAIFNLEQSGANANLTLMNGAVMNANEVEQTANATNATLTVESGAKLTAESVTVNGKLENNGSITVNGKLENKGTITGQITLKGNGNSRIANTFSVRATDTGIVSGELENSGTINGEVILDGGTLVVADDNSVIESISATEKGGKIEVNGSVDLTETMELNNAVELVFSSKDSAINMKENAELKLNGAQIAVTLTDADLENLSEVKLFTSADEEDANWGSYEVTVRNSSTGKESTATLNYNANGDVTLESVPEPTTATLSLLALAALASRRRRK